MTWHPDAESELIDAGKFYNRRVPGLGSDFLDAIDAAVEQIQIDPERFPILRDEIRRCRVQRFPFCVYFRIASEQIRILVISHHSRHSDHWRARR